MRRFLAMAATTLLMLAGGCGGASYEKRLDHTIDDMRYKQRLDANLIAAPKGKFETFSVFIRPPKNVQESKEFLLTALEPGKFDLSESFTEKDKQSVHVLARFKKPPAKKKDAKKPEDTVTRGDFNTDLIAVLNNVYGTELDMAKAKEVSEGRGGIKNVFKHLFFEANGKDVHVYIYGKKDSPYSVALIFEYPKSERDKLVTKIRLTLESFTTGERAKRSFNGATTEEEQTEGAGGPVAF